MLRCITIGWRHLYNVYISDFWLHENFTCVSDFCFVNNCFVKTIHLNLQSWLGKYTDKKYKNVFKIFDKNSNTIVFFGVLCRIFLGVPIQVCWSIALPQPMKNLEGLEWKSCDHVSSQECIADKAGLPPNYTNLEKYICANFVSVHIPNYFLKYNLSAVIVWREKSSCWSLFSWLCWGKKWSVHALCLPQKHVFGRYLKY